MWTFCWTHPFSGHIAVKTSEISAYACLEKSERPGRKYLSMKLGYYLSNAKSSCEPEGGNRILTSLYFKLEMTKKILKHLSLTRDD